MQPPSPEPVPSTVDASTLTHVPAIGDVELTSEGPAGALPRLLGEYELLEEIARGGMGVVYKARHVALNRIVALKMILSGGLAGREERQRFHLEARAVARLQHAHIVDIYDIGELEGHAFFTMEYIPGQSLSQRLRNDALPGHLAAYYMEKVARAVDYAHEHGILHRDLKPPNILLDAQDQPKITDFGLAKVFGPQPGGGVAKIQELTRSGAVMGTPSYMSPEQAEGRTDELGPASDVYSIGAVLYELITARPPFKAESTLETLLQVLHQDAAPPRILNPNVDADLEAICLKCLEKDPTLRYSSAAALAEDLERYLHGEPVSAGSINLLDRVSRTLAFSQHDKQFRAWGAGLLLFALVIFAAHAVTTLLLEKSVSASVAFWIPRIAQFTLLGLVYWRFRPHSILPTSAAERLLWAAWGGYLIAYISMGWVVERLGHDHLSSYGPTAVLAGLAFLVMGSHVWGWCYVIGLGFMAFGPFLVGLDNPNLAPFWFGVLWGVALAIIGLRYYRMGQPSDDTERTGT
jgi:serine/threonine protein kinase